MNCVMLVSSVVNVCPLLTGVLGGDKLQKYRSQPSFGSHDLQSHQVHLGHACAHEHFSLTSIQLHFGHNLKGFYLGILCRCKALFL